MMMGTQQVFVLLVQIFVAVGPMAENRYHLIDNESNSAYSLPFESHQGNYYFFLCISGPFWRFMAEIAAIVRSFGSAFLTNVRFI